MPVVGVGSYLFRARDPETLRGWYTEHLGVSATPDERIWTHEEGLVRIRPFEAGSDPPATQQAMITLHVRDLPALLDRLRSAGIAVAEETTSEGQLARVRDPENNIIELWEPPRRFSRLSLLPAALSVFAWMCLAVALASTFGMANGVKQLFPGFVGGLLLGGLSSSASLAVGGASFLRIAMARREMWGRGVATLGCLSSGLTLFILLAPIVLYVGLFAVLLWMEPTPDFIW